MYMYMSCSTERCPSLGHLLASCDIVTIQLVLSPSTRHIIGTAELAQMKKDAFLINTSRGGLVDTAALVDVLKRRAIRVNRPSLSIPSLGLLRQVDEWYRERHWTCSKRNL